jgi:hypothetical protein
LPVAAQEVRTKQQQSTEIQKDIYEATSLQNSERPFVEGGKEGRHK